MKPVLMDLLTAARQKLQAKGVESASLECEMLLCHILGWQRHELYLNKDHLLTLEQMHTFHHILERRLAGEPVQYIIGVRYFMGLPFHVDKNVLIPRWETELLTEYVIKAAKKKLQHTAILDLGTGSGAIAVSLAVNLPEAKITAVDIHNNALEVARKNAKNNGVLHSIDFYEGDLFLPLDATNFHKHFDIIVSNPPYIPTEEIHELMTEVRDYEPVSALDGGDDGLDYYRRIAGEAGGYLKDDGLIALEIGYGQSNSVQDIFLKTGLYHKQEVHKDLAGIDRFIVFHKEQGV